MNIKTKFTSLSVVALASLLPQHMIFANEVETQATTVDATTVVAEAAPVVEVAPVGIEPNALPEQAPEEAVVAEIPASNGEQGVVAVEVSSEPIVEEPPVEQLAEEVVTEAQPTEQPPAEPVSQEPVVQAPVYQPTTTHTRPVTYTAPVYTQTTYVKPTVTPTVAPAPKTTVAEPTATKPVEEKPVESKPTVTKLGTLSKISETRKLGKLERIDSELPNTAVRGRDIPTVIIGFLLMVSTLFGYVGYAAKRLFS